MIKKRLQSFVYAARGIRFFFKTQANAQIHCMVTILTVILGFVLKLSQSEWIAIVIVTGLVLVAEAINTALEELVNFVSPDYHKQAGIVKDVAAGAVLLAALAAFTIGLIIFLPKITRLFY